MRSRHTLYVASSKEYIDHKERLKLLRCPRCRSTGCLIRHGYLRGYGQDGAEKVQRGWRIFCSNRNLKSGCGKTYAVLLALYLYRRVVNADQLWKFLLGLLGGSGIRNAWRAVASGFCADTGYKTWAAFTRSQSQIRARLHRLFKPTICSASPTPALELVSHLKDAFSDSTCPVASFQCSCQQAFLSL